MRKRLRRDGVQTVEHPDYGGQSHQESAKVHSLGSTYSSRYAHHVRRNCCNLGLSVARSMVILQLSKK